MHLEGDYQGNPLGLALWNAENACFSRFLGSVLIDFTGNYQ
jgi:hypothetical protein